MIDEEHEIEKIREELIELRKTISQEEKRPAFYIFNNKELEKILEVMPRNIEGFKNILPEYKIESYGERILEIIDN